VPEEHQIVFQPSATSGRVAADTTVLEAARSLGVGIESVCGGKQACGKCKVVVVDGASSLSEAGETERSLLRPDQQAGGYRLACAARVVGDVVVMVPEQSRPTKQIARKEAGARAVDVDPVLVSCHVALEPPRDGQDVSDTDILTDALRGTYGLGELTVDEEVAKLLGGTLRGAGWNVTASVRHGSEVVRVDPGPARELLGLAVDLGTTTVAGYLCDLDSGAVIHSASVMNPQVSYGEDVMSRIAYSASVPEGLPLLHSAAVECVNTLADTVTREIGLDPTDISEVVVVGNTLMHHLLLGLDPVRLGRAPFTPATVEPKEVKARDLGISVHPGAWVHLPPLEAAFVGSDNVAVLIAEEPDERDRVSLVIDVGTNGELLLGSKRGVLSASCATGPAFEGAQIAYGMRAAAGAIEHVRIDPATKEASFRVIGLEGWSDQPTEEPPTARGICGSGVIDAVAGLFVAELLDSTGAFVRDSLGSTPRFRQRADGQVEFVLAWAHETAIAADITICQADVRAVQLAKGALYAGARILMEKLGLPSVGEVALAGAFGSSIDPASALTIGMLPDTEPRSVRSVGNAAGEGARMMLLSGAMRTEAARRAREVGYVELTAEPSFQERFIAALDLPHKSDPFPHLVDRLGRERANVGGWRGWRRR
jgi:uncharacterized 2Fe-2S/4Fe-4S cluster protein (DUF4445 family)